MNHAYCMAERIGQGDIEVRRFASAEDLSAYANLVRLKGEVIAIWFEPKETDYATKHV